MENTEKYDNEDSAEVIVWKPEHQDDQSGFSPLEYSVGEICKCYYNEIKKNPRGKVTQAILKCQSFGRVTERNPSDKREYTVEIFEPLDENKTKKVPGCCLRKVKVLPFGLEDGMKAIGRVVRSKNGEDAMMIVSASKDGDIVRVNDIDTETLMEDFVFVDNGAPCGNIVMLKADEAFGGRN